MYPLWSICWDLSILIGPIIGAALSNPAKQYPESWLGQSALFRRFPYLPPCLFCAALTWVSFITAALFFEEVRRYCAERSQDSLGCDRLWTRPRRGLLASRTSGPHYCHLPMRKTSSRPQRSR